MVGDHQRTGPNLPLHTVLLLSADTVALQRNTELFARTAPDLTFGAPQPEAGHLGLEDRRSSVAPHIHSASDGACLVEDHGGRNRLVLHRRHGRLDAIGVR